MLPDLPYWFALTYSSGLNYPDIHDLTRHWTAHEEQPLAGLFEAKEQALEVLGISGHYQGAIQRAREGVEAAREAIEQCDLAGLTVVTSRDPGYPASLVNTLGRMHPPMLFCAGDVCLLGRPCVSMIGARRAKANSLEFTRDVAGALGEQGVCVVSGFAEGVDRCASGAALEAGGDTILFLAQGLLTFGRTHEHLNSYLDAGHLLAVSVCKPREDWQAMRAMQRNGFITAASNETVVAQCGPAGGTWEASRAALRQRKRVWLRADDDPALGHRALGKLGAPPVHWPEAGAEWIRALVKAAAPEGKRPRKQAEWTAPEAAKLLRRGSPTEIHDATGITGSLLERIVEGRETVRIRRIRDLAEINGLGEAAVREVALAFGLSSPLERERQLTLFPDLRGDAGSASPATRDGSRPQPDLSEETKREILEFAAGSATHRPAKPRKKKNPRRK